MSFKLFGDLREARGLEDQFRLERFQVFNWGTFHNYHDIPVPRKGFLFLGSSGSGKTTLLDAVSTMLNPHASVEYNTSARDARKNDRTLTSYVRGAWAAKTDGESREIQTDFLRKGDTWSAVALTYKQGRSQSRIRGDKTVTLLQLFSATGSLNSRVNRYYMILERGLDLDALRFDGPRFDVRVLKDNFKDAFHFKEFGAYAERFRLLLGIESEKALKLLQKTQSMKNIENLETFLKDYMLDKPKTYETTDTMVKEFTQLNAAHDIVLKAKEQIKLLDQARLAYRAFLDNEKRLQETQKLKDNLRSYFGLRLIELLKTEINRLEGLKISREAEFKLKNEKHEKAKEELENLRRLEYERGGGALERLRERIRSLQVAAQERGRNRDAAEDLCQRLGFAFPLNTDSFGELLEKAKNTREELFAAKEKEIGLRDVLVGSRTETKSELEKAERELKALESQRTNIPSRYLEMRDRVLGALNLERGDLPFLGELLDVLPRERRWRAAIERAYGDLALSLVVEDTGARPLADYVNNTDLKGHLRFLRMADNKFDSLPQDDPDSLTKKLEIKEGPYKDWLLRELRRSFDYHCAESMNDFFRHERSLTVRGAVKRGRSFYEKDDSTPIDDARSWVIGFNNREKLELYRGIVGGKKADLEELNKKIQNSEKERQTIEEKDRDCEKLLALNYEKIDTKSVYEDLENAEKRKRELEEDPELKNISQLLERQKKAAEEAETSFHNARRDLEETEKKLIKAKDDLNRAVVDFSGVSVDYEIKKKLDEITNSKKEFSLSNIDSVKMTVGGGLENDIDKFKNLRSENRRTTEALLREFKSRWPEEAADHEAATEYAGEFMAKLDRLEKEDLPKHEKDFFTLLNRQSGMYATQLNHLLDSETREILERLEEVNKCLAGVPFNIVNNHPSYLRVRTSPKNNPDLLSFKNRLQKVAGGSLGDSRAAGEERFRIQKLMVEDLSSQDKDKILWRESVIDVRNHLEFIGVETDADGREIESYRSGSGKSGGQRQKLAATCLAAALRYQLAGKDQGYPGYATVIFDEAFAKTDNDHSKLAMDIFTSLGFQMIMATPNKGVKVAEPYIGGAAYVYIRDRNSSNISLILYDDEKERLLWPEAEDDSEKASAAQAVDGSADLASDGGEEDEASGSEPDASTPTG
ncbi:MAG: ATP-binding protein [Deltaproteobacteria bacterium]|jgi:uncharacterized protein YPO0396|nr:ATP-binding protein [Deltaproteobacteria bacterium]